MLFYDFEAGNQVYKLRLNTRNIVMLEKMLGNNPLSIFGAKGDTIPTITEMVNILYCSLQQYQHNITLDKAYDIFDEWVGEDHAAVDFIQVILEIYKVSGIIKTGATIEKN